MDLGWNESGQAFGMQSSSSSGRGPLWYDHVYVRQYVCVCLLEKLLIKITKLITIY